MKSYYFLLYIIAFCFLLPISRAAFDGAPLILVPGDAGSQLWAKLNKTSVPHYLCSKKTDAFFEIWLNIKLLVPWALDCWVDNMRLEYNNVTRKSSNPEGVNITAPGFGETFTVEWLDANKVSVGIYYAALANNATGWGYTRNKDIRGAPYDFRYAPNEQEEWFKQVKGLIEDTYYSNGNKKVVTIGHSMGNPYMLYFFNHQTQDWKDKFIKSHISIAGPWGGAMKIMKVFASGYNMDHYRIIVSPITLRKQQRSLPSTAWLMPTDKFWPANETLVITDKKNYTVGNFKEFFQDIDFMDGWDMHLDTKNLIYDLTPPGVEIHCLYGTGLQTPDQFIYSKGSFPNYQPTEVMGDGDGTVNLRSALGCLKWRGIQKQAVYSQAFPNEEHLDMLQSPNVIAYIRKVVLPEKPSRRKHFQNHLERNLHRHQRF